jgi:hypothetical protein
MKESFLPAGLRPDVLKSGEWPAELFDASLVHDDDVISHFHRLFLCDKDDGAVDLVVKSLWVVRPPGVRSGGGGGTQN